MCTLQYIVAGLYEAGRRAGLSEHIPGSRKAKLMSSKFLMAAGFLSASIASAAFSAPIVTVTQTTVTRPQNGVTYNALDFFYSSTPGFEFTNYRLIVSCGGGVNCLHDPARLQDDRQYNSTNEANNSGDVDTFANTVMSSAAKEDGGYFATIIPNSDSYNPTGSGAAAPFSLLDWSVFDTVTGDDNNLNDHPDGPFTVSAPYHIARVLASPTAYGSLEFRAFDTANPGVPTTFTFCCYGPIEPLPPIVDPEPPHLFARAGDIVTTTFTATDLGDPAGPFIFGDLTLSSFVPFFPGAINPTFNGMLTPGGVLSWDTSGFASGIYEIDVTATDPDGAKSLLGGNFLVTIFVPEPSTFALCGLLMLAAAGLFRRR
jgi:hypothetical protein